MEYPEVFLVDLDSLPPGRDIKLQICFDGRSDAYRQSIVSACTGGGEIDDGAAASTTSLCDPSQFLLDKDEKITLISGTRSDTLAVTSLTFATNKGNTYTYGDGGGRVFRVQVDGKIIGFHGSYEEYLMALDVIV
ncbi:hypothetical protein OSB04_001512 [Centaurea solstitialis]|uniref:Jacalin-type lectin domain-containing protein n=1 Tax=Centaurea solstitialis TaxID=347529 RepID=A0AA38U3Q9_9ASTR|nr:hypothetical protein OSB04_001512 [Centaurea solstitialis]